MKLASPILILLFSTFLFTSCISFAPKKSEMETTRGKIIESYVDKKFKYRSIYLGHNDFIAYIKYEYEVDGIKYVSDKMEHLGHQYNSKKKAEKAIEPYPIGKEVIVYFKKENPAEAYLKVEDDSKEDEE